MATDRSFFTNPSVLHFEQNGVASAGEYKPWFWHKQAGGDRSNYPSHSGKILDLKDGSDHAIAHFLKELDGLISPGVAIAVVPSHDPAKTNSGIRRLAQALAGSKGRKDASHCLVRHTKIVKLAGGGDRSIDTHLGSIRIEDPVTPSFENVILLDDVSTSGNSLLACQKILLDNDAARVQCLALGRTI
jgi:predicted amidophosphoribosyltransferase